MTTPEHRFFQTILETYFDDLKEIARKRASNAGDPKTVHIARTYDQEAQLILKQSRSSWTAFLCECADVDFECFKEKVKAYYLHHKRLRSFV